MLYETQRKSALALDLSEAGGGLVVAVPAAELAVGVAALEQQAVRGQHLRAARFRFFYVSKRLTRVMLFCGVSIVFTE